MKKSFFAWAILSLLSIATMAQSDAKAKTILDKVSAKTRSYSSIIADFSFSMTNKAAGINETSSGKIILKGNKYKLSMNGVEIINNGTTMWTYMADANEVSISNPESDDSSLDPAKIFTIYENGFKNSFVGEESVSGKKLSKIDLTPTSKRDFSKVTLLIDSNNSQIVSATMNSNDGNTYSIKIKSMDTSKKIADTVFSFDKAKHPNVQINDVR